MRSQEAAWHVLWALLQGEASLGVGGRHSTPCHTCLTPPLLAGAALAAVASSMNFRRVPGADWWQIAHVSFIDPGMFEVLADVYSLIELFGC